MSITVNLYYTGKNGSARAFAEEMEQSGCDCICDECRRKMLNERGAK